MSARERDGVTSGKPSETCGAATRSGGACGKPSGWGTPHRGSGRCSLHGGSTGTHRAAAQVEQARSLARTLGMPLEVDPKEAILQQVHSRAGQAAFWRARVEELAPGQSADALLRGTRGISKTVTNQSGGEAGGFTQESTTTDVGPLLHLALIEWQKAQGALESLCIQAVKIGLDERVVRLTERNSEQFGQLLRAIIDDLHLSAEQLSRVPDVVGRHLQAITA